MKFCWKVSTTIVVPKAARRPHDFDSPQEVLKRLIGLFPEFADTWNTTYFQDDDGSYTFCDAFSEFSHYFREYYEQLPKTKVAELGLLISAYEDYGSELGNAAGVCFLENVAGDRFASDFIQYLSKEAAAYYANPFAYPTAPPVVVKCQAKPLLFGLGRFIPHHTAKAPLEGKLLTRPTPQAPSDLQAAKNF